MGNFTAAAREEEKRMLKGYKMAEWCCNRLPARCDRMGWLWETWHHSVKQTKDKEMQDRKDCHTQVKPVGYNGLRSGSY